MITGTQVRMARAALRLGVRDLASAARVSPATVTRIEANMAGNASTLAALRSALEAAGATFIEDGADRVGVVVRGPAASDPIAA